MPDVWHAPRVGKTARTLVFLVLVSQLRQQKFGHFGAERAERVDYLQFCHLRGEMHKSGVLEYIVEANIMIVNCNLAHVGDEGKLVVTDKAENVRHGCAGWVACGRLLLRCTRAADGKGDGATSGFVACLGHFIIKFGFSAEDTEKWSA